MKQQMKFIFEEHHWYITLEFLHNCVWNMCLYCAFDFVSLAYLQASIAERIDLYKNWLHFWAIYSWISCRNWWLQDVGRSEISRKKLWIVSLKVFSSGKKGWERVRGKWKRDAATQRCISEARTTCQRPLKSTNTPRCEFQMSLLFGQNRLSEEKLKFEVRLHKRKMIICTVSEDQIRSESHKCFHSLTLFVTRQQSFWGHLDGLSLICNIWPTIICYI